MADHVAVPPQAGGSRRAGLEREDAIAHARVKLRFARTQRDLGRRGVALARGKEACAIFVQELGPTHPLAADALRFVAQLEGPAGTEVRAMRD